MEKNNNYIRKWFHFYETTASFKAHLDKGFISPDSICFLEETGQIFTQNTYFGVDMTLICKMKEMLDKHQMMLDDILGKSGSSVDDGLLNNLKDIADFLSGYKEDDNLKDIIDALEQKLQDSIDAVAEELQRKYAELLQNISDLTDTLWEQLELIHSKDDEQDAKLLEHETRLDALKSELDNHIAEWRAFKVSYETFKNYVDQRLHNLDETYHTIIDTLEELHDELEALRADMSNLQAQMNSVLTTVDALHVLIDTVEEHFDQLTQKVNEFIMSKGHPDGLASLGEDGKVPQSQLPSYVDDVLEYATKDQFPEQGEKSKIYVDLSTDLTYRWSGTKYIEISKSLALGETNTTAYPGDKGKKNEEDIADEIERAKGAEEDLQTSVTVINHSLDSLPGQVLSKPDKNGEKELVTVDAKASEVDLIYQVMNKEDSNVYQEIDEKTVQIPAATTSKAGVMTSEDKTTFDKLTDGLVDDDPSLHALKEKVDQLQEDLGSIDDMQVPNTGGGDINNLVDAVNKNAEDIENEKNRSTGVDNAMPKYIVGNGTEPLMSSTAGSTKVTITYKESTKGDDNKYGAGADKSIDIPAVTTENAGVMSPEDKKKLDQLTENLVDSDDSIHDLTQELEDLKEKVGTNDIEVPDGTTDGKVNNLSDAVNKNADDIKTEADRSKGVDGAMPKYIVGSSAESLISATAKAENVTLTYKESTKNDDNKYGNSVDKTAEIPLATQTNSGVMSPADKKKLDMLTENWTESYPSVDDLKDQIDALESRVDDKIWRPSVAEDGTLSWTLSAETTPPSNVNIKGKDGKDGTNGEDGAPGTPGAPGKNGENGSDGIDGTDGKTWKPEYDEDAGQLSWVQSEDTSTDTINAVIWTDGSNGMECHKIKCVSSVDEALNANDNILYLVFDQ